MDLRIRLPGAIARLARDKAGDEKALTALIVAYVTAYATGQTSQAAGGRARADSLTPARRREIAVVASRARWAGHPRTHE